jgi:hypothetical protein
MLYDPKWEPMTKAETDALSLECLIAWLEKQPADMRYCFGDTGHCMFAQYFTAMGLSNVDCGGTVFSTGWGRDYQDHPFPIGWPEIASGNPHTFACALHRARKLASRS